jgi:hypothetical protein
MSANSANSANKAPTAPTERQQRQQSANRAPTALKGPFDIINALKIKMNPCVCFDSVLVGFSAD